MKEPTFRQNVLSIINVLPQEFGMSEYIDYETQFNKSFLKPLKLILDKIDWATEKKATLEDFFLMSGLDFDFGFTAVTEDELDAVIEAKETAVMKTAGLDKTQEKCDTLYNMIKPLLNNLAKNPEKDYIYWEGKVRLKKD